MSNYYLGGDLSLTGTGLVIIDDNYQVVKSEVLSSKITGTERLFHLRNRLADFVDEYGSSIKLTALENYAYGKAGASDGGRVFEIGEWGGIVRLYLFENDYQFILPSPSQLKKYVSGKGDLKIKKELIILDIYKNFGIELRDNNAADGYILARIAKDFYCNEKNLTTPQHEVIKALHKSIDEGTIGVFLK